MKYHTNDGIKMLQKLSIITVCFNEVGSIGKTLSSVVEQTFKDFEWLVIDGGSSDGTVAELLRYRDHFAAFVSEKDSGIYDAMNKGIALAKGEYLLFLNGGDYISDVTTLESIFANRLEADFIYGDITVIGDGQDQRLIMPPVITKEFLYRKTIPHQSTFTKKSLFGRAGIYDTGFKIVADYEFILRCLLLHNATFQYVPVIFSCYLNNGVSSDAAKRKTEKKLVHNRYYSLLQRFILKYKIKSKLMKLRSRINWPGQNNGNI